MMRIFICCALPWLIGAACNQASDKSCPGEFDGSALLQAKIETSAMKTRIDYDDLGSGKCLVNGKDPAYKYYGRASNCEDKCSRRKKCYGYSASYFGNCLLWMEPGLSGGGASWGGAHCRVKHSGAPPPVDPAPTEAPTDAPKTTPLPVDDIPTAPPVNPNPTPAPTPAPPIATPAPGGSKVAKSADCGSEDFTQAEAQEMLDWHNKFRCAVGVPPLEWNGELQCQAQDTQKKEGGFSHSDCYNLPISSGENLATGTSVSMAAWMWFTEYTQADCTAGQSSKCGHYTAMVWKSVTHLGCGIQRDGDGVIRCQYAASPPNYASQYSANVPTFMGEESKYEKCGLTIDEAKEKVGQFQTWGILHPIAPYASSLGI